MEKLERENAELRTALIDALGMVIGEAITVRKETNLESFHPIHAELIARIKRLTAKD